MRWFGLAASTFGLLLLVAVGCGESESDGDGSAGRAGGGAGPSVSGAAGASGVGSAPGAVAGGNAGGHSAGADSSAAGAAQAGAASSLEDCNTGHVSCKALPPQCAAEQVPSVEGTCWGECVDIERCACSAQEDCPDHDRYTCWGGQHCGPYVG